MVKIFSNFDTTAPTKNYARAVQEFGFDRVVFLRRHKLYFILYTILPAFIWLAIIGLFFFTLGAMPTQSSIIGLFFFHTLQTIGILFSLYLILTSWANYFNYTLDYTIITPWYISAYNQKWLFTREIRTVEPEKIKTINFLSTWIINSLFNFGEVYVLLEGEEVGRGEISINYIYKPEAVKNKILQLADQADEAD